MNFKHTVRAVTAAVSVLLCGAACAQAKAGATSEGSGLKPGLWEILSSHDAFDAKSRRTVTSRICYSSTDVISPSRIVPPTRGLGVKCEVSNVKAVLPDITWRAVCRGPEGSLVGTGTMKAEAMTYTAQVSYERKSAAKTTVLAEQISGRWTGECS